MTDSIDYKLGQISSDISSIRKAHEDDKAIRDENHAKIHEISNSVSELKQIYLRLDSWKNGQTVYQQKALEDMAKMEKKLEVHKEITDTRLKPLELDLKKREDTLSDTSKRRIGLFYDVLKFILLAALAAVLVNMKAIYVSFIGFISH